MAAHNPDKTPDKPRPVIIRGAPDARIVCAVAAELDVPIELRTPPGAAAWLGPMMFAALIDLMKEEFPDLELQGVLDCGDKPGHALAAIRAGVSHIRLTGPTGLREKITAIAEASGTKLHTDRRKALDFADAPDPERTCRDWLQRKNT